VNLRRIIGPHTPKNAAWILAKPPCRIFVDSVTGKVRYALYLLRFPDTSIHVCIFLERVQAVYDIGSSSCSRKGTQFRRDHRILYPNRENERHTLATLGLVHKSSTALHNRFTLPVVTLKIETFGVFRHA